MANPFISMEVDESTTTVAESLPELEEFAWDFEKNCFLRDVNGNLKTVYDNEALKVWIYKCLKSERYRYTCYIHGRQAEHCYYGVLLEKYIGKYPNNEATAMQIKKEIREAILANPYVMTINYIEIHELKKEKLILNMSLESIYGELEIIELTL
ncbi:MAG: DUF2634 domain-containing protein [Selenomonadaceae bacterium]|nr:DUF2634 domain-containing protein [Selenomonadaceae bacterium]